jgi:hypothetical protein
MVPWMNVRVYEYLCDLNQRYQQMLDTLQQLAVLSNHTKSENLALYELRLRELQSDSNAQVLEQLLEAERQTRASLRKQRREMEVRVLTSAPALPAQEDQDRILQRWMEKIPRSS